MRRLASLVLSLIAATALAAPASATKYLSDHYAGTDAFSYDDCGFTVDVTSTSSGILMIREGRNGDASAFFGHNTYQIQEIHVRRSDGRTLIVAAHGLFQETRATRVSGSLFEFSSVSAGQPFMVTDASGAVLVRDSGAIRQTILFDTLGDATPGGNFIESVAFSVDGPHPGMNVDLCTLF